MLCAALRSWMIYVYLKARLGLLAHSSLVSSSLDSCDKYFPAIHKRSSNIFSLLSLSLCISSFALLFTVDSQTLVNEMAQEMCTFEFADCWNRVSNSPDDRLLLTGRWNVSSSQTVDVTRRTHFSPNQRVLFTIDVWFLNCLFERKLRQPSWFQWRDGTLLHQVTSEKATEKEMKTQKQQQQHCCRCCWWCACDSRMNKQIWDIKWSPSESAFIFFVFVFLSLSGPKKLLGRLKDGEWWVYKSVV